MKQGIARVLSIVILILGVGLTGRPALAKCTKTCRQSLAVEARDCRTACPKGKPGKDCRKTCRQTKSSDLSICKSATNPTPPECGRTSASGAFTG